MYILRDANVGRHRDSNNFGPTAIEAFGDFVGAGFLYWATDPKRIACPEPCWRCAAAGEVLDGHAPTWRHAALDCGNSDR